MLLANDHTASSMSVTEAVAFLGKTSDIRVKTLADHAWCQLAVIPIKTIEAH